MFMQLVRYQLIEAIEAKQREWQTSTFDGTYPDAKDHLARFAEYKRTTKRSWVKERQDLSTAYGNLQTKMQTSGLKPYIPPQGLTPAVSACVFRTNTAGSDKMENEQDLDECWSNITEAETRRSIAINANIRE
jgi:hypothetical protein